METTFMFDEAPISPELWIQPVRVDLRRRLVGAVLTIARNHAATALDIREALGAAWEIPPSGGGLYRRLHEALLRYGLAPIDTRAVLRREKITLIRLTGARLGRAVGGPHLRSHRSSGDAGLR